jgi:LmbE family N-acetylglucosaminyl deacetylase
MSLLAVYAHPDDEQGISGSFAKYAKQGVSTGIICATRGEVGEIAPNTDATRETLGAVREAEMRCAAAKIGVRQLHFLNYRDSGMAGTPENDDERSLNRAHVLDLAEQVTALVRKTRPQVMITFDAWGGYGHPDHIAMHKAALMAFWLAPDPRAFAGQLGNGLEPWTPLKLYYNVWPRSRFAKFIEHLQAEGKDMPDWLLGFEQRALPEEVITTRIDVSEFVRLKIESLQCHATQLGPNSFYSQMPPDIWEKMIATETLMLAESRTARVTKETDLFEGITEPEIAVP